MSNLKTRIEQLETRRPTVVKRWQIVEFRNEKPTQKAAVLVDVETNGYTPVIVELTSKEVINETSHNQN